MANATDMETWTSFPALRARVAQWSAAELLKQEDVLVEGQLMHKRRISRKCSFFDLASAADGERGERLEVILKIIDDELSLEQVEVIRHRVKVGDVVHVRGFLERQAVHSSEGEALELLLHARDIVAVRPWKLLHPGETFVPVPTVREAEKAPPTVSAAPAASPADGQTSEAVRTPASGEHCKFWINSKTCQFGDKCEFAHERDAEAFKHARAEWLTQRLRLKRERAALDEDPLDPHGKMSKAQRAQVLGDWLVATVGVPCLSAGRGVLDIAGGRGDVSFELWNKRGIPCTLIDPRPLKLSRTQFKYLKKQKTRKEDIPSALVPQRTALFNDREFLEDEENAALVRDASLLVGMHPDEATDAIIDVALQLDKPFVVVPCCVFGQTFPHRRKPDGGRVVSFEDLVEYLLAKSPDIQRAFLPIDGKNMVLYRLPRSPSGQELELDTARSDE